MRASVIINTYNRARSLERLLPSLDHLRDASFEVIVVNGPSTDDTAAVLSRYLDRIKVRDCPTPNLSRSRNVGIAAAAGEVVVFIDDDAIPGQSDWLRRLIAVFEQDVEGRVGAAGGASLHRDTDWFEFAGGWTSDYAEQVFGDTPPTDVSERRRWCRRTVGNNSAFRRSALVAIGGFDEQFAYYLDEADVCLRLVRSGYEVAYLENCAVRHYPAASPMGQPFIRNRRLIARSDTYYSLKNGGDRPWGRLIETLRRAPRKHFVRELPDLVANGTIDTAHMWRLRRDWVHGLIEGLAAGLFATRRTWLDGSTPPPFVAFDRTDRNEPGLSIALLSRHLPPDPHAGGVGRYTWDLARALHELGHRITILTESEIPIRWEALDFEVRGVHAESLAKELPQAPVLAHNLAYAQAVRAGLDALAAAGQRPDVVHASNWGIEALGLAQRQDLPLVLMLVTPLECVIEAEGWDTTLDLSGSIELDQWTIDRATRVCAPSSNVLSRYHPRAGWADPDVHIVPLGIVTQAPVERPDLTVSPRRRLLFVGRLERRKGIHVLLDVLPRLLDRHPNWQCDLVGDNTVTAESGLTFEALFRNEHPGASWMGRVAFHGAVSDEEIHRFYRQANLFVAPSLFESFGLIYLEAMQYGVPVVGCDAGGVPEVVAHESHGLLVPPGDAAALASALDRLMQDDELRTRFGRAASESVKTHRTHIALGRRMEAEYRAALDPHRTGQAINAVPAMATNDFAPSVTEAALAYLEVNERTQGFGLAVRAVAARDQGAHEEAAALIATALGVSTHPGYLVLAVDLALDQQDLPRAHVLALRGFLATRDDSEACLAFAATIIRTAPPDHPEPDGWAAWRRARRAFDTRLLAASLAAIRLGRDASAIAMLETCLSLESRDPSLRARARYHLGSALKRRGLDAQARTCFEQIFEDGVTLVPDSLRAALHFHVGELDFREHRLATAIEHFDACLQLNAGHQRARALRTEASSAADAAA
jgi:glycogen synthase